MRILQPDISETEMAAINAAVVRWEQRDFRPIPVREVRSWRRAYYGVAALAAFLIVGVIVGVGVFSAPAGEAIVQEEFARSESRPFKAQMSDEPYKAWEVTRSARTDKGIAAETIEERAPGAHQSGRLYLLEKDYDRAILLLQEAAAKPKVSPQALNDLGVAYLERDNAGDLESARKAFDDALVLDKSLSPAVFNMALVYERQHMAPEAILALKRYLDLDPKSGWATEVHEKLEELQK
jgi:tetratricopeptide (TPR) repeat protein